MATQAPKTVEGVEGITIPYTLSALYENKIRHIRILRNRQGYWPEGELNEIDPYPSVRLDHPSALASIVP